MNDNDSWNRAYMNLGRSEPDPEPPARYTEDAALYIVAAIALFVIIFGG